MQIVFKNLGEKRNTISYELPLCAQHLTTRWTRWIGENLISWINQLNYTKNDTVHTSISMWAIFLNQHFLFNYILLGTIFRQTGDCCFSLLTACRSLHSHVQQWSANQEGISWWTDTNPKTGTTITRGLGKWSRENSQGGGSSSPGNKHMFFLRDAVWEPRCLKIFQV